MVLGKFPQFCQLGGGPDTAIGKVTPAHFHKDAFDF